MLKYKCLVLDHDDTVFDSTKDIHYPVFMSALNELRPGMKMTLDEYNLACFDPGFGEYCNDILKLSEEEMELQLANWDNYVKEHIPSYYEGFDKILKKQKSEGGLICVVSHSLSDNIKRDYIESFGLTPDMIFGWDKGDGYRKPNPFPLEEIMRVYNLKPDELLMVDDLKPGFDMAKKCKVDFACAGWEKTTPLIKDFMKKNCDYYLETVDELYNLLFSDEKNQISNRVGEWECWERKN